jgi:hypothetical protein
MAHEEAVRLFLFGEDILTSNSFLDMLESYVLPQLQQLVDGHLFHFLPYPSYSCQFSRLMARKQKVHYMALTFS